MRQLVGKLILLVGSIGVLWGAGEIVLRQLAGEDDDTPLYTSSADPFVPRLLPGTSAVRAGVRVETNELGLRGESVRVPKPAGAFRILCLGDSYTFGTGIAGSETLPSRLALELGVECVNMGIEGANTYDNEARLLHIGLDLEPDLVVLFYLFNDVHRMERGREWMAERRRHPGAVRQARDRRARRSLVVEYLRSRVGTIVRSFDRNTGRLGIWNDQYRPGVPAWEETCASILAMRDACLERDIAFALAVMPALTHFSDSAYPLDAYRREMLRLAGESGIPAIDLHEPFWGESGRRYWLHPLDPHPNARAAALMASHVAGELRRLGLVAGG